MLDHVTIGVSDIERSKQFYDQALLPLAITRLYGEGERFAGYGIRPKAFFWIGWRDNPQTGAHIAFAAKDAEPSSAFTRRRSRLAPASVSTIIRAIMVRSFSIPTAIISKRFAIRRRRNGDTTQ